MEIFKSVFKQTSWQLIGKAISSIATVIALGLISRTYGPEGTGVITLALTYLAFFSLAVDFGINAYILPYLLRENYILEWKKLLGLRIVLASLLFFLSISLPFILPTDQSFRQLVLIGAFFAVFEAAIFISVNAMFQAKLRYDLSTLAYGIGSLVEMGLIALFSLGKVSLGQLILAYCGGWVVISILALVLVRRYIPSPLPVIKFDHLARVLKQIWPISLALILNTVYFRLDSFVISFFHPFSDVGIYNVAYSVFQSALVVPTFIMNAFFPLMIKALEQEKKYFRQVFSRACLVMLVLSVLGTVLTLILAPIVITLITGEKGFSGSIISLQILSLSFPAFFLSALGMWTLVTLKKYKTVLIIYSLGLLVNGLLNFLLVPQYSYLASSWVTIICEYLILILQVIILGKEFYGSDR